MNWPLIYIHDFLPVSPTIFLLAPLQLSSQKHTKRTRDYLSESTNIFENINTVNLREKGRF